MEIEKKWGSYRHSSTSSGGHIPPERLRGSSGTYLPLLELKVIAALFTFLGRISLLERIFLLIGPVPHLGEDGQVLGIDLAVGGDNKIWQSAGGWAEVAPGIRGAHQAINFLSPARVS